MTKSTLRLPAHHRLGRVFPTPLTAIDAIAAVIDNLRYEVISATVNIPGESTPLPVLHHRAIVRLATPEDPQPRALGMVGDSYHLVQPSDLAAAIDAATGDIAQVETVGILNLGRRVFITLQLPPLQILGDQVERLLAFMSPYDGRGSLTAEIWPVRVACQNTLRLDTEWFKGTQSLAGYRMRHTQNSAEAFNGWVQDAYQRALASGPALESQLQSMAQVKVLDECAAETLEAIYPDAEPPRNHAPDIVMSQRRQRHAADCQKRRVWRNGAFSLFAGAGAGMTHPSCNGTVYGLYNAVCEAVDHSVPTAGLHDQNAMRSIALDATFGAGARVKQRAFAECMTLVQLLS